MKDVRPSAALAGHSERWSAEHADSVDVLDFKKDKLIPRERRANQKVINKPVIKCRAEAQQMLWYLSNLHFSQEVMLFRGDSEVRTLDILTSG